MTNEIPPLNLDDLGYDGYFAAQWQALEADGYSPARVIAEHKEAYRVKTPRGEYPAKITGELMFRAEKRADYPAVGDWVAITEIEGETAVIHRILPRKTVLKKKYTDKQDEQIIAANLDLAFIIESLDRDFNLNRFERYLVLVRQGGVTPVIVLNKTDLVSPAELEQIVERIKNRFDRLEIIAASALSEHGLEQLESFIVKGKTCCFLGSSGVGKSSLLNKLLKQETVKTQTVSEATGRGKHTTTARGMYFLAGGGMVIDNPGTREVGIAEAASGIENVFEEIARLGKDCKFADCSHRQEAGCAVLKALEQGKLDEARYQNYLKLKKENDFYEMTGMERREKDKKFGQFIKKVKHQLKKLK